MKNVRLIVFAILLVSVLVSCSNSRYGHLKKVKVDKKAIAQKQERRKRKTAEQLPQQHETEQAVVLEEVVVANETIAATENVTTNPTALPQQSTKAVKGKKGANLTPDAAKEKATTKTTTQANPPGDGVGSSERPITDKSQLAALVLVFFVGVLGIHRFYLGYTAIGILQLLTLGGCGIWAFIDLIRILIGDLKPKDGEYGETF